MSDNCPQIEAVFEINFTPSRLSELENDVNFVTEASLSENFLTNANAEKLYAKKGDVITQYGSLNGLPQINGITLTGNKLASELNLASAVSLDNKADLSTVQGLESQVESLEITLNQKADITRVQELETEINTLETNLTSKINTKANTSDLNTLETDLTNQINSKANTSDLTALETSLTNQINTKVNNQSLQDLSSQTEVTIASLTSNTYYKLGTSVTSLTITALDSKKCMPESVVTFTAGDNITVNIPEDIQVVGEYSFEAGKSYVLSIWNNIMVVGEVI